MKVLVTTDGSAGAEQAARMVALLNYPAETEITLLGVSETSGDQDHLKESIERIKADLGSRLLKIEQKIKPGQAVEQIITEARQIKYDLIAVGARGQQRGLIPFRIGSTTNQLAKEINSPLLVARNVRQLAKILVCTAAEPHSIETVGVAGKVIASSQAEITLLHVMSQVALRLDSPPADLHATAETAISSGTREGQHFQRSMELLREEGVTQPIHPLLKHGLVVDQVLEELEDGRYDLLVIGAHYHMGKDRWLQILLEDITGQLLVQSPCSVMIV